MYDTLYLSFPYVLIDAFMSIYMRLLDLDTKLGTLMNAAKQAYDAAHKLVMDKMSSPSIFPPVWTGEPTVEDVLKAREILAAISHFPPELVDAIIDFAEYWPHTTSFGHESTSISDGDSLITRSMPVGYPDGSVPFPYPLRKADYASGSQRFFPPHPDMTSNYTAATTKMLDAWSKRSMPTNRLLHPVRKIVFKIKSHDQGWGGGHHDKGTFTGSYTWFDAGIERFQGVDTTSLPSSITSSQKIIKPNGRIETPSESDNEFDMSDAGEASKFLPTPYLQFHNRGTTNSALPGWDGYRFDLHPVQPAFELPTLPGQPYDEYRHAATLKHSFLPSRSNASSDPNQPDVTIQKNRTATIQTGEYEVTWRWDDSIDRDSTEAVVKLEYEGRGKGTGDGSFVRNLKVGDVVSVWARARFPGWANHVEEVVVKVYWAI